MVELNLCTIIEAPIERCFDLSRSIEVHLLGTEQTGEQAVGGVTSGLIGLGEFVRWRATHLGVKQHLASKITAYDRPSYFQDTMIEGAFRSMQHDHFFKALSPGRTEMKDRFVFAAPLPILGLIAEKLVLRRYMHNLLTHRNDILKQVAESDQWKALLSLRDPHSTCHLLNFDITHAIYPDRKESKYRVCFSGEGLFRSGTQR